MKSGTSRLILMSWLISCQVINTPIMGVSFDDYDDLFMEDLYEELKPMLSFVRRLSEEEENLKLFYNKEWLPVTSKTLESVIDIRCEIIKTTQKANYVSLFSSAVSVTGNMLGIIGNMAPAPIRGLSLLITHSTSITVGGIGFNVLTGLGRYSMSKELCKIATIHIETNKQYTNTFYEKLQSYFDNLEKFKNFLSDRRRNKAAILLFHKIAESKGFLRNLYIDKQTEEKLRDRLLKIIESDISKIKPYMRAIEFAGGVYDGTKALAGKISNMLSELKDILNTNSNLLIIILDEMFSYNNWPKKMQTFEFENPTSAYNDKRTTTVTVPLLAVAGLSIGSSRTSKFLKEKAMNIKSVTSNLLKNKAVLASLKALFVAGEVYVAGETIANLQKGSTSVESEELLKVIDKLHITRETVIEEMKICFGW